MPLQVEARAASGGAGGGQLPRPCPVASVCLRAGVGSPGQQTRACLGVCWPSLVGRGTEWAGLLLAKTLSLPVRAAGLE